MIITIDGPVASGKSTVARDIAEALGWYHINSGYLYRVLAYIAMRDYGFTVEMVDLITSAKLEKILSEATIHYRYGAGQARILLDGKDVTNELKHGKTIDEMTSYMSRNPAVRAVVDAMQHDLADKHDVVVDGRDAGSVVFPDADYKFFLTADLSERARRWREAQKLKGELYTRKESEAEITGRDKRDSLRAVSPLRIPEAATVIDNTGMSADQTVADILNRVRQ